MAESFEEVTTKLAVVTLRQIPVLGLLVEAAEALLPPDPNEKIKAAVLDEMGDTVIRLQAKVEQLASHLEAQGKKLDDLGPMRTIGLTREVAESVAEAKSPEKREAVLNAAARQFDPSYSAAARDHWLQEVRNLTDVELIAIRLTARYGRIFLDRDNTLMTWERTLAPGTERQLQKLYDLQLDEIFALADALPVTSSRHLRGTIQSGLSLTDSGRIVARFVTNEEPVSEF